MRLPVWFRQEVPDSRTLARLKLFSDLGVRTVCQEAHCPNLVWCFSNGQATFLILGDTCTRNCRFCAVKKAEKKIGLRLDLNQPQQLALAVKRLRLGYVVITSVTRDDLLDVGAQFFAQTIKSVCLRNPAVKVEALIPDFGGRVWCLRKIIAACPFVIAHNLETVPRLYPQIRPQADYQTSLRLLGKVKELSGNIYTKSSLLLGLGETEEEVIALLQDLRRQNCDYIVLGQYLRPSPEHYPVKEFISLAQFERYHKIALELNFKAAISSPLARTSYKAEEICANA